MWLFFTTKDEEKNGIFIWFYLASTTFSISEKQHLCTLKTSFTFYFIKTNCFLLFCFFLPQNGIRKRTRNYT